MPEFERYFATRRYQDLAIRPDGGEVAYATDISGSFNAWRQDAAGGWPYQLTDFHGRAARRVAWSPDGARLAVAADREGDEREQILVLPARGGVARQLTSREDVRYLLAEQPWAPDGRTLACACNAEDPANFDLVLLDARTGASRRLTREPVFHLASCWSPDGRYLCGVVFRSNVHQEVVVVDRESGDVQRVTEGRGEARRHPIGFSADNSSLYLLTDEGRPFQGLARFDLERRRLEWIKIPDWDIDLARMSAGASRILYVVNEDAVHRVRLFDRNAAMELQIPQLPMGQVQAIDIAADGSRVVILHEAARHPAEVVVLDPPRKDLRTITHGMIGGIPPEDMVEPEIVRYPSFDRKIPAQLYRPRGEAPPGGFPAVLFVHGGPEAQEQPHYRPLYQYLLAQGLVVLAPNIRGSTGYGKAYQKRIRRDFGGDDLKDLEAAAQYLKTLPYVDADRLGVAGGSYGGFAALSCATRQPEHWAAAVDICGATNLVTFAQSVPRSWRRFMREWVGDPEQDKDELLRRSPISYVDELRCPVLVIQGAHDPRVVKDESDQMVARIRERGGSVDYLVFDDEGHGFLKRENQVRAFRAVANFLLRQLTK